MCLHWWRRRERRGRPAVSLFLHSPYILQSAVPFVLGVSVVCTVRQRRKPVEPAFQTLTNSLYPAPVLIAICFDPAINPHSHFSCRKNVVPYSSSWISEKQDYLTATSGGSHRLKRNASPIESRCKTSKIPNLIGFRITASALLVISS